MTWISSVPARVALVELRRTHKKLAHEAAVRRMPDLQAQHQQAVDALMEALRRFDEIVESQRVKVRRREAQYEKARHLCPRCHGARVVIRASGREIRCARCKGVGRVSKRASVRYADTLDPSVDPPT